jgi:hypothetical protein
MRAWIEFLGVIFSKTGITNEAVFPVPFLALARISLPANAMGIDSSWIGEGRSKPASKIPMSRSLFRK